MSERVVDTGLSRAAMRGFTLIEGMIVLLIIAIVASVAVPSFRNATLGSRLGSDANELTASLITARGEAIKRNDEVTVCASADAATCATSGGWEQGWIVVDLDDSVAETANEIIEVHAARAGGFKVIVEDGGGTSIFEICFPANGVGVLNDCDPAQQVAVTFTACRATPDLGPQERVVALSATGRPSVKRTDTGSCS